MCMLIYHKIAQRADFSELLKLVLEYAQSPTKDLSELAQMSCLSLINLQNKAAKVDLLQSSPKSQILAAIYNRIFLCHLQLLSLLKNLRIC